MYGIDGVVLQDTAANCVITLTQNTITIVGKDSVVITSGSTSIVMNSDGSFNISGTGAGVISAGGGMSFTDGVNTATIATMQSVFSALIAWLNTHTHTNSAGTTTAPDTPYSGGNIIS